MSDFLTRLAQRQLGQTASVEPRVGAMYAPVSVGPSIVNTPAAESPMTPRIAPERPLPANASALNNPAPAPFTARQRQASGKSSGEQRAEANSARENISERAAERINADITSLVVPNDSLEPRNIKMSVTARTEDPDSVPLRQESPAHQESTLGKAPRRLVDARVTAAATAPPRLGATARERASTSAPERGPADSEPPVHVTIGRIEVTAVTTAPTQRRAANPRQPAMSLDDYLARRQRRES